MTDPGPPPSPAEEGSSPVRLPPWIPRLLVVLVLTVLGTLVGVWVIQRVRGLLVSLLLALFLSFALEPAVKYLADRGWRRGLATAVVFAAALLLGVGFIWVTLPPFIEQLQRLVEASPGYVQRVQELAERWFGLELSAQRFDEALAEFGGSLQGYAGDLAGQLFGIGTRVVGFVFQGLTIALFTFYLLADGPRFRRALLSALSPERQREVLRMWEIAIEKTGGYVYSRLLLAAAATLFTWVALRIIGVPYALALALWVGIISQFVPAVGTYIAAVVPTAVALFNEPVDALWVVGVLAVYQQIENYLLAPKITAQTMALHPAMAFGSAIAGASIMGALGALIALPAAAIIQAFVSTYLERHQVVDSHLTASARPSSSRRELASAESAEGGAVPAGEAPPAEA